MEITTSSSIRLKAPILFGRILVFAVLPMFLTSSVSHKTAKLTVTYSYIVLIAYMSDIDNFHLELFRQLKGFDAAQSFSTIRFPRIMGRLENGINQLFFLIHSFFPDCPGPPGKTLYEIHIQTANATFGAAG